MKNQEILFLFIYFLQYCFAILCDVIRVGTSLIIIIIFLVLLFLFLQYCFV